MLLAAVVVTGVVSFIISRAAATYLRSVYRLPQDLNVEPLIQRRLYGLPLVPPPLSWFLMGTFIGFQEAALEDDHWARLVGGPAKLIVNDGVALYLERGDQTSRVVGPGSNFLERYERIKDVIDLKPQRKSGFVMPWTKDGIRIQLTIMAECQISASLEARAAADDLRYPFDEEAVRRAVEHITVKEDDGGLREAPWLEGAWGTITGAINAYVARHSLDELFLARLVPVTNPAAYSGMIAQLLSEQFSTAMLGQINSALAQHGVKALNIQITKVVLPDGILDLRIKYWESEQQILSARKDSKAEADSIRVRQQAFVLAQQTMLKAITEKLEKVDPDNLTEPLILSLSGLLDQGLNDPIVRPLLAKESFAALERLKRLLDQEF
jgi:cation transporter-like permease